MRSEVKEFKLPSELRQITMDARLRQELIVALGIFKYSVLNSNDSMNETVDTISELIKYYEDAKYTNITEPH
tara:strand:- start:1747 stop:1962 length:216 start_codon:yes stop_codon:yes gene_type:complete